MNDTECVALLQWGLPRMGLRWRGFSTLRGQVCKRITRRLRELGMDVDSYRRLLARDPEEWRRFDSYCRVTISRFYRDRAVFEALRRGPLLELASNALVDDRPLRLWSAGAASGEEPYTLALICELELRLKYPELRYEIVATELEPRMIARAKAACYPSATLRELPPDWRAAAFESGETPPELHLKPEYRRHVRFLQQDLRKEHPRGPFDAIFCRNVAFTYFDEETQRQTLSRLRSLLRPNGLLVIGREEKLPPASERLHPLGPGIFS